MISAFRWGLAAILLSLSCPAQGQTIGSNTIEESENIAVPDDAERPVADIESSSADIEVQETELESADSGVSDDTESMAQEASKLTDGEGALTVTDMGSEVKFGLLGDVLFDFDKSSLRPQAINSLESLAAFLSTHKVKKFRIVGHTDSKGSEAHNLRLSQLRAESVAAWLETRMGAGKVMVDTAGMGAVEPVAPNEMPDGSDNPGGRQQNRRVEIFVLKKQKKL